MPDTPETTTQSDEEVEEIVLSKEVKTAAATDALLAIPSKYSDPIQSHDWKGWNVEDIAAFVLEFHVYVNSVNELRSMLDKAIWQGKANGSVDPRLSSIRDEPDATNKRGRKAVELTAAERALKKLGKLG